MPETSAVNLFSVEYEQELRQWLYRRFRLLCWTYLVLDAALVAVAMTALWAVDQRGPLVLTVTAGSGLVRLAIPIWYLQRRDLKDAIRDRLLRAASVMVLLHVLFSVIAYLAGQYFGFAGAPTNLLVPIFIWHLTACALLPWTPGESMRPFVLPLLVWAVLTLAAGAEDFMGTVIAIVLGPLVFLPGLAICAWRLRSHGREFERRMVTVQFRSMRRELARAREIHESLFPPPYDDGFVRFDYTFEPTREMGGDYIHLHVGPSGLVHAVVLDVTGHGLDAALTVNRMYGELERIRAETPDAPPGDVLTLLNRYVYGTMARHELYATAACLTVDPYDGEILWASGGHPPAFLRGERTGVHELGSTAPMLGVFGDDRFEPNEMSIAMSEGDLLLLYTDGVVETRDRSGRQFGKEELRSVLRIQPPPSRWTSFIAARVAKHRDGRSEDDILIACFELVARRAEATASDGRMESAGAARSPMAVGEQE